MIIQVEKLKKSYKKKTVLHNINIFVEEPTIVALVGPNGSGKTTLLNCMANLLSFDEGKIRLLEKNNGDPNLFYDMSFLQDNRILYPNLTVYDHLKFVCDMQKINYSEIDHVIQRVGMQEYPKKRIKHLSLGMKQHLLLAMSIINKPKLLLLDEPFNGMDPTSSINMREILIELFSQGTTVLVSSHNLDQIDRLTDTVLFIKNGTLLRESLRDLSSISYSLTMDDAQKTLQLVHEKNLPVTIGSSDRLQFDSKDISLREILKTLHDANLQVIDIEKIKYGAEMRYQQLFEEDETS